MMYFPMATLDDRPELHAVRASRYVSHLLAMDELPIHPPAAKQPVVYRLLFLPTFEQPAVVRLTEIEGAWRAICKWSDGQGGYSPGRLVGEAVRELSQAEAKQFARLLDRVGFWDMPSSEDSDGLDGTQAVLEGARAGAYHVVDRWTPRNTPYAELVDFLLGLFSSAREPAPEPPKQLRSFAELADRFRPSRENGPA